MSLFFFLIQILDLKSLTTTYSGDIPLGLSPISLLDTQLLMWRLDSMCRLAPADQPANSVHAREWDAQTLHSWLEANVISEDTKRLAAAVSRGGG